MNDNEQIKLLSGQLEIFVIRLGILDRSLHEIARRIEMHYPAFGSDILASVEEDLEADLRELESTNPAKAAHLQQLLDQIRAQDYGEKDSKGDDDS